MSTRTTGAKTSILAHDSDPAGELRSVSLSSRSDGALCVREATSGALTEAVFGCPNRYHEIGICRDGIRTLERVHLGRDAPDVLREFFASGVSYLTDLMDELDGLGVAYSYMSCLPTGDMYFRPPSNTRAMAPKTCI